MDVSTRAQVIGYS